MSTGPWSTNSGGAERAARCSTPSEDDTRLPPSPAPRRRDDPLATGAEGAGGDSCTCTSASKQASKPASTEIDQLGASLPPVNHVDSYCLLIPTLDMCDRLLGSPMQALRNLPAAGRHTCSPGPPPCSRRGWASGRRSAAAGWAGWWSPDGRHLGLAPPASWRRAALGQKQASLRPSSASQPAGLEVKELESHTSLPATGLTQGAQHAYVCC